MTWQNHSQNLKKTEPDLHGSESECMENSTNSTNFKQLERIYHGRSPSQSETSISKELQELTDKQYEQELNQISVGLKNLQRITDKAELKSYASSTVYGVHSIQQLLPVVEAKLQEMYLRFRKGNAGVAYKEIKEYIFDIEPLVAAGITLKVLFDKVFSADEEDALLTNIYDSVGRAMQNECQLRYYQTNAPGLLHTLKENYWHRAIGTDQKVTVVQTLMNRYGVNWKTWPRLTRVKLGSVLVDAVCQSCDWFEPLQTRDGRNKQLFLIPSASFSDAKDKMMEQAELFTAECWPMLIPPRPWSLTEPGGYLLDAVMRGHDMVRRGNPTCIQGEAPVQFLNKIQEVAYTLNDYMVEVSEVLYERGITIGKKPKFIPHTSYEPLPPKPVDIETNKESRHDYCRRAADVHSRNNALKKKSVRTQQTMKVMRRFKGVERFYHVWSFDYRGRVYPIAPYLSPQDTDWGKSLIRFADEAVMMPDSEAADWLRFQVATTYGLDKKPMAERLQWARDHEDLIHQIAIDPLGKICDWEVADEPFQFLAACEEYNALLIDQTRTTTGLPIAVDATCSGLQILSGLAKDASTARLVNVLPSESPQDAYKAVAEYAKPNCPEHLQDKIDRSVAKRLVMTIPYNAKFKSNWGYVKDALVDKGVPHKTKEDREHITAVTHALRNAVWDRDNETGIFPGPIKVMDWIEEKVSEALANGATELCWTTPSGFKVSQKIMKPEIERAETQLLGKIKKVSVATGDSDVVNTAKHKSATSPNLIHSLDASILCLSSLKFDHPLALIHDSVLCRATDMACLSAIVRETYMHLFAEHEYLVDWGKQIGSTTPPPMVGDLEPESVIESTYFFC
jgi:hypothetical protein